MLHTRRAHVVSAMAQRSHARADFALAQLAQLLEASEPSMAAPAQRAIVAGAQPPATDVPLATVASRAARSVMRGVDYRLRWRWRRLRRLVVRLREEYGDLKQLDVAAHRDRAQQAAEREAHVARRASTC